MKSPLIIVVELLYGIVNGILQTILFIFRKFGELLHSLLFFSTLGVFGVVLAIAIGVMVFLLVAKFIFKSSKTLLAIGIALIVVIAVLALLWMI